MDAYSPATRHLVLRLLNTGLTHSQVAQKLGIGRATVTRINRGRVQRKPCPVPTDEDLPPGFDPQRLRRCPGCGWQVYLWPCLKCELEGRLEFPADLRPSKRNKRKRGRPRRAG